MRNPITVFLVFPFCLVSFERCLPQDEYPQGGVIHVEVVGLRNDDLLDILPSPWPEHLPPSELLICSG